MPHAGDARSCSIALALASKASAFPLLTKWKNKVRGTATRALGLDKIRAPLLAINFADDLINPPELGILEQEIKRLKKGRAKVIPASTETVGHGTHTRAAVWKEHLEKLMKETER